MAHRNELALSRAISPRTVRVSMRRRASAAVAAVFSILFALVPGTLPAQAQPMSGEDLLPVKWLTLSFPPVEWRQVAMVPDGGPVPTFEDVPVLMPGDTVELRTKLLSHNVPSSFAPLHVELAQITDAQGNSGRLGLVDLGAPEVDNGEVWTHLTIPESYGGAYMLAFTADPAAQQPGYLIDTFAFVVPPPLLTWEEAVGTIAPGGSAVVPMAPPAPAPPAPVAPAPAAPAAEPAPAPAPAAPAPAAPAAQPAAEVAGGEGFVPEGPEAAPVAFEAAPPAEHPSWMLPLAIGAAAASVVAVIVWRVSVAAQRRASFRRLASRP